MKLLFFIKQPSGEKGLTLLEILISIAISGLIIAAVTMTIEGIFDNNTRSMAHTTSVKQVENSVHWISRDVLMAQSIVLDNETENGLPAVLSWVDWDNTRNVVTYSLQETRLQRRVVLSDSAGNVTNDSTTIVAENIDPDAGMTEWQFSGGVFGLKITSAIAGFESSGETRNVEVIPRSSQIS